MSRDALEDTFTANDANDAGNETERRSGALENRPLLNVHLEEEAGQLSATNERRAADASPLLVAEDDHGAAADAFNRLDPGDDAERAVKLPAARNRVEVRAGPDGSVSEPTDEVFGIVDLDPEPSALHPRARQLVRALLTVGPADAIRTRAAADRIQLIEPLENAH
jgi:hypothetical protein